MFSSRVSAFLALALIVKPASCKIDMKQYYRIPKSDLIEDYDKCFELNGANTVYCYVNVRIKPDTSSKLWNYIENISNDNKHYRHDRLLRLICLNDCETEISGMSEAKQLVYDVPKFKDDTWPPITFPIDTFLHTKEDITRYGRTINICMNKRLHDQFNLTTHSEPEYCTIPSDANRELDVLDILFVVLCIILITSVILSSSYDFHLNYKLRAESHYVCTPEATLTAILVSFSIYRNWKKLLAPYASDDHKTIPAFRVILSILIICVHIGLLVMAFPQNNQYFVEKMFTGSLVTVMLGTTTKTMSFFCITSFLLSSSLMTLIERKPELDVFELIRKIVSRCLRVLPLYSILIFFSATWLTRLGDGPVWKYYTETEYTFCRRNSWTNFLFVNNIVLAAEPCMQHGWFIGADFQLHLVTMIIFAFIWKWQKFTSYILGLAFTAAIFILSAVIFVYDFDGIYSIKPAYFRHNMVEDYDYMYMHTGTIPNAGSYVMGLIFGFIYQRLRKSKTDLSKNKAFVVFWYMAIPFGILLLFTTTINLSHYKPSIWIVLQLLLLKNVWGFVTCVLLLGFRYKIGGFARDILEHRIFLILGRLTYCVYLVHPIIFRAIMGRIRTTLHISHYEVASTFNMLVICSFFSAFVLVLIIETPFSNLVDLSMGRTLEKRMKIL